MNLYSLNRLVNSIANSPKKSINDCLYLNTLLNDACLEGCTVTIDKVNKNYLITGKEVNYVFKRVF
jgi:hypothetical protein